MSYNYDIIHLLGKKWSLPIMNALFENGELRFNQLKSVLQKNTPTTFSSILKELEYYKIIQKKQDDKMFSMTSYSLTPFGKELFKISVLLTDYANTNDQKFEKISNVTVTNLVNKLSDKIMSLYIYRNSSNGISKIEQLLKKKTDEMKNNIIKSFIVATSLFSITAGACIDHGILHITHLNNII